MDEATQNDMQSIDNLLNEMNSLLNWDTNKVTKVRSADGVVVPVPKGFTASQFTGNTAENMAAENTVARGFVIYEDIDKDGDGDIDDSDKANWTVLDEVKKAQKERNQFVWVPVNLEKTPMFTTDSEGNTVGQLYNYGAYNSTEGKFVANNPVTTYEYSTSSYHEPDILKDATNGDYSETNGIPHLRSIIYDGNNTDTNDVILAKWEQQLSLSLSVCTFYI